VRTPSVSGAAGVLLGKQEVQSKVILVDFSVTLDGLEEQLLGPRSLLRSLLRAACWGRSGRPGFHARHG
jgi:hypothetical protein